MTKLENESTKDQIFETECHRTDDNGYKNKAKQTNGSIKVNGSLAEAKKKNKKQKPTRKKSK